MPRGMDVRVGILRLLAAALACFEASPARLHISQPACLLVFRLRQSAYSQESRKPEADRLGTWMAGKWCTLIPGLISAAQALTLWVPVTDEVDKQLWPLVRKVLAARARQPEYLMGVLGPGDRRRRRAGAGSSETVIDEPVGAGAEPFASCRDDVHQPYEHLDEAVIWPSDAKVLDRASWSPCQSVL